QVTIATNMAGRGTDIKLGPGVVWLDERAIKSSLRLDDSFEQGKSLRHQLLEKPCGLHVIGSERHESRRIDRQLRGRCARQGDPGSSRFYISLEDELMRLFGSDKISGIMTRLGMQEGEALEHRWLNRSVETAQRRVEQQNFSIRKRTLEYDDVMNKQREVIYAFRQEIVCSTVAHEKILDVISDLIQSQCERFLGNPKDRQEDALSEWVVMTFPVVMQTQDLKTLEPGAAAEILFGRVQEAYEVKCSMEDSSALPMLERHVVLSSIDTQWQEFLRAMDDLRHGVGLRAYGQRDPLVEYKREAFQMFEELMANIKLDVAQNAFRVTTSMNTLQRMLQNAARRPQRLVHEDVHVLGGHGAVTPSDGVSDVTSAAAAGFERAMQEALPPAEPMRRDLPKVGRNDACPCGSGKKSKKCCGQG
ncbi:MAG: SEC-C metal-binding domain-containing protein, partial [bacterium]